MLAAMMASPSSSDKSGGGTSSHVLMTYGLFLMCGGGVWHLVADGAFSCILTLSVMVQCLALSLLALQVLSTGSAAGISAGSLFLDALAICCRLSSTLWLNGYLPVDKTGDHVFQGIDICSLAILIWLLYQVRVEKRDSYQAKEDSLRIFPIALGCLLFASLVHGNMNGRIIFDTLWMNGLLTGSLAVLPQLWLITRTGGRVEAMTAHYIAAMAASRILAGIFFWHARRDITCIPWITGFNHTSTMILTAHLVQILMLGDFGYMYIKGVLANGWSSTIQVVDPADCGV